MSTSPKFHVANIQKLLTKRKIKKKGIFIKEIEKIKFLRDMCKEEKPYFLAFAETWLKENIKEAEYDIEGYSHVASHRKNREREESLFTLTTMRRHDLKLQINLRFNAA